MVFMRAANTSEPLRIQLDELSSGRNFTTLTPRVLQSGKLCASGIMRLDVTAPDVIRHAAAAPDTPGPYESQPFDMSVTGRDIRFVDGAYTDDPNAPVGPPMMDAWVRFREVPEDPYLHAGLLAQFTGHVSIAAALRPHKGIGQSQAHRTLSTAINGDATGSPGWNNGGVNRLSANAAGCSASGIGSRTLPIASSIVCPPRSLCGASTSSRLSPSG